ncbi:MAG: peptidoglycan-binding protein [Myxococcaceae bacterium]|nr:peptidoglycan-binding protein [Myxococcaceae bacterium]
MRINDGGSHAPRVQPSAPQAPKSSSSKPAQSPPNTARPAPKLHADSVDTRSLSTMPPAAAAPRLPVPASDLRRGQSGTEVRQLQEGLVSTGYLSAQDMATGPGQFGPRTEAALKRLQSANGLSPTGVFDASAREALTRALTPSTPTDPSIPAAGMRRGNEGGNVLQLQNSMVQLGYMSQEQVNTGPGIFGAQTERSVKALQVRNGLSATGVFDEATQAALAKEVGQYKDPSQMVQESYQKLLGREPSAEELSAATARAEEIKQFGGSLSAMRQDTVGAIRQTDEYRAAHPIGSGTVSTTEDANEYFLTQWGGTPYNSASGAPFGYNDCGPTSAVMALSAIGLMERPSPENASATIDAVRDAALGHDTTQSQRMGFGSLQRAVQEYGGQTQMINGIDSIDQAIERGNPVVIGGNPWQAWGSEQRANGNYLNSRDPGGHFVTVLGKTQDGKYIVGDPLVKNGTIAVSREQLQTFFQSGFGAMEVYRP